MSSATHAGPQLDRDPVTLQGHFDDVAAGAPWRVSILRPLGYSLQKQHVWNMQS